MGIVVHAVGEVEGVGLLVIAVSVSALAVAAVVDGGGVRDHGRAVHGAVQGGGGERAVLGLVRHGGGSGGERLALSGRLVMDSCVHSLAHSWADSLHSLDSWQSVADDLSWRGGADSCGGGGDHAGRGCEEAGGDAAEEAGGCWLGGREEGVADGLEGRGLLAGGRHCLQRRTCGGRGQGGALGLQRTEGGAGHRCRHCGPHHRAEGLHCVEGLHWHCVECVEGLKCV